MGESRGQMAMEMELASNARALAEYSRELATLRAENARYRAIVVRVANEGCETLDHLNDTVCGACLNCLARRALEEGWMGALNQEDQVRLEECATKACGDPNCDNRDHANEQWLVNTVRRLAGRVEELEDEAFRARNRVVDDLLEIAGKNICDPLAGVSVAALHAYRAPTAPREAARYVCDRCKRPRFPWGCDYCSPPTDLPTGKEEPGTAGNVPSGKEEGKVAAMLRWIDSGELTADLSDRATSTESTGAKCGAYSQSLTAPCDLPSGHPGLHESAGDAFHQATLPQDVSIKPEKSDTGAKCECPPCGYCDLGYDSEPCTCFRCPHDALGAGIEGTPTSEEGE